MADVTNPGSVNAADEAFGVGVTPPPPPLVDRPSSNSGPLQDGGGSSVDGPISSSIATSGTVNDANQTIDVAPPMVHRLNVDGGGSSVDGPISSSIATSGTVNDVNQTVDVAPPMVHRLNVDGGTFNPQSANTINTSQNNVAGQQYGTGTPKNVFV